MLKQDEIIEMARQAGATEIGHKPPAFHFYLKDLQAFAKLVADVATAKEREACAKVCEDRYSDHPDLSIASGEAGMCAYHIRARGEAK
jgi:hypothetical protein